MNIIGEKIILRAIEEKDAEMFLEMINDPETESMIGGHSFPVSKLEQEQWIRNQTGNKLLLRCVIVNKDNIEKGLGTVILSDIDFKNGVSQVHIKMVNTVRGKGLGSDALKTIVQYAFNELRMHCLYAEVLTYNHVSQSLFEHCGFKKDGILRSRVYKYGAYQDMIAYSIIKDDVKK